MAVPILYATRQWYCPNCTVVDETPASVPNRFHTCGGLRGLSAPLLVVGTKAKVTAHEREDYVGSERVQTDAAGRPVMSVITEREDGQDVVVFAPTATATGSME